MLENHLLKSSFGDDVDVLGWQKKYCQKILCSNKVTKAGEVKNQGLERLIKIVKDKYQIVKAFKNFFVWFLQIFLKLELLRAFL